MSKVKEISLIGILAAVNIASRIALQAVPNVKPVTSIIILSVMIFGLAFGIKLTLVTTLVSNIYLGMGIWTFFQILAWIVICLLTQMIVDFYKKLNQKPNILVMAIFAFIMGYVFGFIVSLDKFVIGGPSLFIVYYLAGLLFDTFHAVGNFLFFFLLSITHIENICSDSFRKKYYFCNKLLKPRNEENTHRTFATYHHSYYTWYRYRKFPADTFGTAVRDLQLHLWRIPQFLHTSYHSRTGYHCHSRYW